MKKILVLLLTLVLAIGTLGILSSCGGSPEEPPVDETDPPETPKVPVTVELVLNGGTVQGTFDGKGNVGEELTLPTVKRTFYSLEGWYTDEDLTQKVTLPYKPTAGGTVKLYAKWVEQIDLDYRNLDGATIANDGKYTVGFAPGVDTLELPKATMTGFDFLGWYFDAAFTQEASYEAVNTSTFSRRLYAKWGRTVTLTYNLNGGTADNEDYTKEFLYIKDSVVEGTIVPTVTKAGEDFVGWYTDAEFKNPISAVMIQALNESTTLYARFNKVINIIYNHDGAEVTSLDHTTKFVTGDANIKLAEVIHGFDIFEGWFFDTAFTQEATPALVSAKTEDVNLYAKYKPIVESYTGMTYNTYSADFMSGHGAAVLANSGSITFSLKLNPESVGYQGTDSTADMYRKGHIRMISSKYTALVFPVLLAVIGDDVYAVTSDNYSYGNLTAEPIASYTNGDKIDIVITYGLNDDGTLDGYMTFTYYVNGNPVEEVGERKHFYNTLEGADPMDDLTLGAPTNTDRQNEVATIVDRAPALRTAFWQFYNWKPSMHEIVVYPGNLYPVAE